jgi:hypothetical protein
MVAGPTGGEDGIISLVNYDPFAPSKVARNRMIDPPERQESLVTGSSS